MLVFGSTASMGPLWARLWLYGAPGSGKTTAAAFWPQPFYLLVYNEDSETSLKGMSTDFRYAKIGVPPPGSDTRTIVPVRKDIDDLGNALLAAAQQRTLYQQFGQTLVVDNMSHLNDMIVTEISDQVVGRNDTKGEMHQKKWGDLRNFYLHMRDVLFSLPMHVIFVSYEGVTTTKENTFKSAGPKMQGAGADLLPGSCSGLGFCEQNHQGQRLVHFSKQGHFPARHRYYGVGPGPFNNHELWRHFGPALGHQV